MAESNLGIAPDTHRRVDCADLIKQVVGHGYAHEYDDYLALFRTLAQTDELYLCVNVPASWGPFIRWLGHQVESVKRVEGWDGETIEWCKAYVEAKDKRRIVEIASTVRPELVHALYCADTEWSCPLRAKTNLLGFPITCNGSFFRDEVLGYKQKLNAFKPTKRRAVIVPCAAEKPYPSPLHSAVLDRIDTEQWHVIVATGVLGLVPQELWPEAPHYDSGLPNLFRCSITAQWFFSKFQYEAVVVYSDFYAYAFKQGLDRAARRPGWVSYVLGNYYRDTYENLLLEEHLMSLEFAVQEADELCSNKTA